jgi:hypothetical protein
MDAMTRAVAVARLAAGGGMPQGDRRDERGDVPGWVLITLMTAGLVTVLWAVARTELVDIFHRAMSSVTG